MIQKIKIFLQEARHELRHVNWPSRREAIRLTGVVVFLSLAIAVFLGAFDYLFGWAVQFLILK